MTNLKSGQNCVIIDTKKIFLLSHVAWYFHCADFLFTCLLHLQGMQIKFPMLFKIFKLKDPDMAENQTHFLETQKIVGLCRVCGAGFFRLQGTLDTWWNQGNTKCQGEGWSGLSRESRGPRPCWTLKRTLIFFVFV